MNAQSAFPPPPHPTLSPCGGEGTKTLPSPPAGAREPRRLPLPLRGRGNQDASLSLGEGGGRGEGGAVFSRVKGERGRVQVWRRPTVSALSGPVSVRRVDHHASLAPPHRTGRAVFPHPALGRVSHPGMRRWRKMKAPKLEYAQLSEDDVRGEALRPSRRNLVPLLLGLGVQRLLEPPELR